MEQYLAKAEPS